MKLHIKQSAYFGFIFMCVIDLQTTNIYVNFTLSQVIVLLQFIHFWSNICTILAISKLS